MYSDWCKAFDVLRIELGMKQNFNRMSWAIRVALMIAALLGVLLTMMKLKDSELQDKANPPTPAEAPATTPPSF